MEYYCFLCNEIHNGGYTKEHFIPQSLDSPKEQWLPVCDKNNTRSNSLIDSKMRDIFYWPRFKKTEKIKRTGTALLKDGTLKNCRFSYCEPAQLGASPCYEYCNELDSDTRIPINDVYAVKFLIGLDKKETQVLCQGIAKMTLGTFVWLLRKNISHREIKVICSQFSFESLRHMALDLPWNGDTTYFRFSLGSSGLLSKLQLSCSDKSKRNHKIEIKIEDGSMCIEGMIYSAYAWQFHLNNAVQIDFNLQLENSIYRMNAPDEFKDVSLSPDSVCIINPNYLGKKPKIPENWKNKTNTKNSHHQPPHPYES